MHPSGCLSLVFEYRLKVGRLQIPQNTRGERFRDALQRVAAGIVRERKPDPQRDRRWRIERDEERRRDAAKDSLVEITKSSRDRIVACHPWNLPDAWENSPQKIDCHLDQSIHGSDFWQTDYDPVTRTWSRTYNIPVSDKKIRRLSLDPTP